MNDINKLGKITDVIGKLLFGLLVTVMIVIVFAMQLTKYQNEVLSNKIAVILGTTVAAAIFYFALRILFRPIYNLNKNIQLRMGDKLTSQQFKSKWLISLICSVLISLLPVIPTFGFSIVIMIPQFLLLHNSNKKLIQQDSLSNFHNTSNLSDKPLSYKSLFRFNLKKMTKQEQLILTVIIGIIVGLFFGYIIGENQYYSPTGRRINLSNINNNSVKVFKFNYLLFFCGFVISSGTSYLLISRMSQQKQ